MSLSPEFLQYLANVGISEENFTASSIGERTLAFNNFKAFQQQQQLLAPVSVIISILCISLSYFHRKFSISVFYLLLMNTI